eukprot:1728619-Pyramimonas_sp.AAC.1
MFVQYRGCRIQSRTSARSHQTRIPEIRSAGPEIRGRGSERDRATSRKRQGNRTPVGTLTFKPVGTEQVKDPIRQDPCSEIYMYRTEIYLQC